MLERVEQCLYTSIVPRARKVIRIISFFYVKSKKNPRLNSSCERSLAARHVSKSSGSSDSPRKQLLADIEGAKDEVSPLKDEGNPRTTTSIERLRSSRSISCEREFGEQGKAWPATPTLQRLPNSPSKQLDQKSPFRVSKGVNISPNISARAARLANSLGVNESGDTTTREGSQSRRTAGLPPKPPGRSPTPTFATPKKSIGTPSRKLIEDPSCVEDVIQFAENLKSCDIAGEVQNAVAGLFSDDLFRRNHDSFKEDEFKADLSTDLLLKSPSQQKKSRAEHTHSSITIPTPSRTSTSSAIHTSSSSGASVSEDIEPRFSTRPGVDSKTTGVTPSAATESPPAFGEIVETSDESQGGIIPQSEMMARTEEDLALENEFPSLRADGHLAPSATALDDAETLLTFFLRGVPPLCPQRKILGTDPRSGDREAAADVFERLMSQHQVDVVPEASFGLGRVRLLSGDIDEARELFESAVAADSSDATYHAWLGWALLLKCKGTTFVTKGLELPKAHDKCMAALALDTECTLARRALICMSLAAPARLCGGWPAAEGHALRMGPTCEGLLSLGQVLMAQGTNSLTAVPLLLAVLEGVDGKGRRKVMSKYSTRYWGDQFDKNGRKKSRSRAAPLGVDEPTTSHRLLALEFLYEIYSTKGDWISCKEVCMKAAGVLHAAPVARQRANVLLMKALGKDRQWEQLWSLAQTELRATPASREVLYQACRQSHFDGRPAVLDLFLGLIDPLSKRVPAAALADVQYLHGELCIKRGLIAKGEKLFKKVVPALQQSKSRKHFRKATKAENVLHATKSSQQSALWIFQETQKAVRAPPKPLGEGRFSACLDSCSSCGESDDWDSDASEEDETTPEVPQKPLRPPDVAECDPLMPPPRKHIPMQEEGSEYQQFSEVVPPETKIPSAVLVEKRTARLVEEIVGEKEELENGPTRSSYKLGESRWNLKDKWASWRISSEVKSLEANHSVLGTLCSARYMIAQGEEKLAEVTLKELLNEHPTNLNALVLLVLLYRGQGKALAALAVARRASAVLAKLHKPSVKTSGETEHALKDVDDFFIPPAIFIAGRRDVVRLEVLIQHNFIFRVNGQSNNQIAWNSALKQALFHALRRVEQCLF